MERIFFKKGRIKKRRYLLTLIVLAFFYVVAFSLPAEARSVIIQTNEIDITPGTPADGGTASFSDSVDANFSEARAITNGALDPGDAFTIHDEYQSGTISLSLSAPDGNVPGGTRNRTRTISTSYSEIPGVVFFGVDTSLNTINDSPPPVVCSAAQTGFNLEMRAVVEATLSITEDAPYTGYYARSYYPVSGYHYEVTDVDSEAVIESGDITSSSYSHTFNLDPANFPVAQAGNYSIQAYAYNGYTTGHGGTYDYKEGGSTNFETVGEAPAGVPQTHTFNFTSNVDDGGPGINALAVPFAPDENDKWHATGNAINIEITTADTLIKAINEAAGANVVSSFGKWTSDQILDGVMIVYNSETLNDIDGDDLSELQGTTLVQGLGYQIYISQDVDMLISNTE